MTADQAVPEADKVTLEIIENALKNVRFQMDAVVYRTAMSPIIREQHDEFPLLANAAGDMIVGQFGSFIGHFIETYPRGINPGDVFLLSDPYRCEGAISHINDWLVLVPVFYDGDLVGWSAIFGNQNDVGGPAPGSLPPDAVTIFGEGITIPPVKLYSGGQLQEEILELILNNVREPAFNKCDLMALVAGCRVGEQRIIELCERFGKETYLAATDALLERTRAAMEHLIEHFVPEEEASFEDYVDDDGRGNGPFKIALSIRRDQGKVVCDFTGTSPQAEGPINFYLNERMFKMLAGAYMISLYDPQILFNDGYLPLFEVIMPAGCLLQPERPAALGSRTHTMCRWYDVLAGALSRHAPEFATAAGWSSSPHIIFSGYDKAGEWFTLFEIGAGGIPGRPVGDGMDGHTMWPWFSTIPAEYIETYYPLRIVRREPVQDSGGAGLHRGGNGVETVYRFLVETTVAIMDDRWLTYPWGINGGSPGERGARFLVRAGTTAQVPLPAKVGEIIAEAGDELVFRTWGGGGWGDPLERPLEVVAADVRRRLVSYDKAREEYGTVVDPDTRELDVEASDSLRERMRSGRGALPMYSFGPSLQEILATAREETGLEPPRPPQPLAALARQRQ